MRPADEPQVHVGPNAAAPGLVTIAIGTGTDPYSVTTEFAIRLAGLLLVSAAASRDSAAKASRDNAATAT
ncbi:hypothetical protein [Mycobacterium sp.]|uniref:hypothetical protein n=1 Tax=Mycobacterium sp. TaxID=1785 RepID=UPI003BB04C5F